MAMTSKSFDVTISKDDPTLPGHFPGSPVTPGALLLDIAITKISEFFCVQIIGANNVKFKSPVLPDERLLLVAEKKDENKIMFTYFREESLVVTGTLDITREGKI
jgi:3-hydroxymyristoyl/3-hydroxydecanoyl-(acyl carrier protein) dehydratase